MIELNNDPKYLDDKPLLRILILTVVSRQFFSHQQKFCKKLERFGWKFTETVSKVKCHNCKGTGMVVSGQHNLKCYGCDNGIETLTAYTVLWNNRPVTMDDN